MPCPMVCLTCRVEAEADNCLEGVVVFWADEEPSVVAFTCLDVEDADAIRRLSKVV